MNVRRMPAPVILAILVAMCLPLLVHAQVNVAGGEDQACIAFCAQMAAMPPPGPYICPQPPALKPCQSMGAAGVCMPDGCKAKTADGKGVDSGLGQLSQILGQLLGQLMKPKPPSSPSPSTPPPSTPTGTAGCAAGQYFQTSDVTQLSNPCAQYAPPASPLSIGAATGTSAGGCDTLSQLLGTCQNTANTNTSTNLNQNVNQNPTSLNTVLSGSTTGTAAAPALLGPGNGPSGDILFSGTGATIFGTSLNVGNNTGVAGFFGSDTFGGGQPQGIAAKICEARPWAAGFLNNILPVAFFDGLCTARGYHVGPPPAPAPVVQLQQSAPAPKAPVAPPAATTTVTGNPRVQIWAVPASVPLATRTSIFWSTQDVTNCTETSPDGSFSQNSLSGGAATVPLTGATTFTISCSDSAGNPVTSYVTVNLSI